MSKVTWLPVLISLKKQESGMEEALWTTAVRRPPELLERSRQVQVPESRMGKAGRDWEPALTCPQGCQDAVETDVPKMKAPDAQSGEQAGTTGHSCLQYPSRVSSKM